MIGRCFSQGNIGASIQGTAQDPSGLPVSNVPVSVTEVQTRQVRMAVTGARGDFQIASLPVGTYDLQVQQPGFAPYVRPGITLSLGQTLQIRVELVPAQVSTQVTVNSATPALDPSQTSFTSLIDQEFIEESPVRTRNALDFVLLAPGVAAASPISEGSSSAYATSGFTFGGLRPRSNSISLDGFSNNDQFSGASRTELSPEIVKEFQIVNNGLSAQYGGSSGGSVNVVTRGGANDQHGDAFLFAQNDLFNARTPLENDTAKPSLSRYRWGVSNGGALRRDQTFYYGAFEQEHQRGQGDSAIHPTMAAAVNQILAAGAFPRLGVRTINPDFYPVARVETEASGRIDHQINPNELLMVRYAFLNNREAGDAFHSNGLIDPSGSGSSFVRDHSVAATWTSIPSPHTVNEAGFQYVARNVALRTNDSTGPGISITGMLDFGRPYAGNDRRSEQQVEAHDVLSWSLGSHLLKSGLVVNHTALVSEAPDGFGGIYLFNSLVDFAAGQPSFFLQSFGNPRTAYGVTSYGGFLQDHWALTRRVTVEAGVRYDYEQIPPQFQQDKDNFSPRIELAYTPASGWVLRTGFGIFFDRYVLANLNRGLELDGRQAFQQVANAALATSLFQGAQGGSLMPSIYRADPHLATSYSEQASFGIEHQIASHTTADLNYQFVRGVKLSRTRNVNLVPQSVGSPSFGAARLEPQWNDVYQLENSASSTYHGLTASLHRQLANEIEFSANYTWSKAIDDASDFEEQPQDPYHLRAERALSRYHQEHRFVASGLFDLPWGDEDDPHPDLLMSKLLSHIELAPILTASSAHPVNPLISTDANGSQAFPLAVRPAGFGRNTLWVPGNITLDFRMVKYFPVGEHGRLDLVVDAFNLLNRTNITQINPWFGTGRQALPTFAHPVEAASARQFQFSLDFEF